MTRVVALYATAVLIWGSTWFAIKFQLGPVAEEVSVAWRFGLASISLFVYAAATGRRTAIPRSSYGLVVVMGVLMYSINYMIVYHATNYLASGLVAVVFSLIVLCNGLFERLFFGRPFEARMLMAAMLGIGGVALLFWPEISTFNLGDQALLGFALGVTSVVFASLGNMAAIVSASRDLPVIALNAHGMLWGAIASLLYAVVTGHSVSIPLEPGYLWSLAYLSIFGSAIAFGAYLALIRLIGSARAAYTSVLFPIVALTISTVFEGYQWSAPAFAGLSAILAGNWLALTKINKDKAS